MTRFAVVLICLLTPVLGGWTIVTRDELARMYANDRPPELSAAKYLDEGIRPYALEKAAPIRTVLEAVENDFDKACDDFGFRHSVAAFPCNFWVEVKGVIVKIDSKSQSGRAWILPEGLSPDPSDEKAGTVILMIGPAIDSMGPRDGYPDLKYELFNDQTKFGAFGREINRLLSGYIREKMAPLKEASPVNAVGVLSTWDAPYDTPEIVPVIFK
jgi:predicted lipoprotein